ncbi:MAG TPA: alginate export family protein [Thermoanaerobaculia bacterium]|nr:alginate export family protein [Thermoanaerobaculia bacterium]
MTLSPLSRLHWRVLRVLLGLALPLLAGSRPLAADWLVTRESEVIETVGPWRVQGSRVVFRRLHGPLVSLPVDSVDLEASRRYTEGLRGQRLLPPGWQVVGRGASLLPPAAAGDPSAEAQAGDPVPARGRGALARLDPEEIPEQVEATRRHLTELEDEERPESAIAWRLWGRPLIFSGGHDLTARFDGDLRPHDDRDDRRSRQRQKLQLELYYQASPKVSLFVESDLEYQGELGSREGAADPELSFEGGEIWLHWADIGNSHWSLQLGRQSLRDDRRWWYSGKLDAVRARYERKRFEAEIAVAANLSAMDLERESIDAEDEDLLRAMAWSSWRYRKRHRVELFAIAQRDRSDRPALGAILSEAREDESDADLDWLGLRWLGSRRGRDRLGFEYWVDLGRVRGREDLFDYDDLDVDELAPDERADLADGENLVRVTRRESQQVDGWALDLGVTLSPPWALRPSFTFGYAVGSGDDDPRDGIDSSFRQTGLQSNADRYRGVHSFRYYGELLDPELSNLEIGTLSVGFPILGSSSIELVAHSYRQVTPATSLRRARLRTRPSGVDGDIGEGLDLVIGFHQWERARFRLFGSWLRLGSAYGVLADTSIFGGRAQVLFAF